MKGNNLTVFDFTSQASPSRIYKKTWETASNSTFPTLISFLSIQLIDLKRLLEDSMFRSSQFCAFCLKLFPSLIRSITSFPNLKVTIKGWLWLFFKRKRNYISTEKKKKAPSLCSCSAQFTWDSFSCCDSTLVIKICPLLLKTKKRNEMEARVGQRGAPWAWNVGRHVRAQYEPRDSRVRSTPHIPVSPFQGYLPLSMEKKQECLSQSS